MVIVNASNSVPTCCSPIEFKRYPSRFCNQKAVDISGVSDLHRHRFDGMRTTTLNLNTLHTSSYVPALAQALLSEKPDVLHRWTEPWLRELNAMLRPA